jgi:solute carrier family 10 (sodium/bile acid cotransporter), member 7
VKPFFARHWFLIMLLLVLLIGGGASSRLSFLLSEGSRWNWVRQFVVASVLFFLALPLEIDSMWKAARRPWAPLLAVAVNFGLLPVFARLVSLGLTHEMAGGLLVAASTPCSLASAAVWTRRAGGNDSVAILVTIITNSTCFLITPLWLMALTGQTTRSITLSAMVLKLGVLVVSPMLVAQLLRAHRSFGRWATRRKARLTVAAQCGVLFMVMLGAARSTPRLTASGSFMLADLLAMIAAVIVVHLTMLATGIALARMLRFSRDDCIAVGFAGSQKTLPVGLQVAMDAGMEALPMVAYHVSQLVLDTLIADRWRSRAGSGESGDMDSCKDQ